MESFELRSLFIQAFKRKLARSIVMVMHVKIRNMICWIKLRTLLYKPATESGQGILATACCSKHDFKEYTFILSYFYYKVFISNITFYIFFKILSSYILFYTFFKYITASLNLVFKFWPHLKYLFKYDALYTFDSICNCSFI